MGAFIIFTIIFIVVTARSITWLISSDYREKHPSMFVGIFAWVGMLVVLEFGQDGFISKFFSAWKIHLGLG